MQEDRGPWREAWEAVTEQHRLDAPRRTAGREAYEATRQLKGEPVDRIRSALKDELLLRGIADLTPAQLDLLVEAIETSPRRMSLRIAGRGLSGLRKLLGEVRAHSTPAWTNSPRGTPRYKWRDDQNVVRATVEADAAATKIVAKLFAEVPHAWGLPDEAADSMPRAFGCWVSIEPSDHVAGTLTVHVGKHVIGRLRAEDSRVVRPMIASGRHGTLEFDAAARGSSPQVGSIEVGLPDRA